MTSVSVILCPSAAFYLWKSCQAIHSVWIISKFACRVALIYKWDFFHLQLAEMHCPFSLPGAVVNNIRCFQHFQCSLPQLKWNTMTADAKSHLHFLQLSLCWGPSASCYIFLSNNFKAINELSHTATTIYDSFLIHRPLVGWEKLVTGPNINHTKTRNEHCCHQVELD